MTSGAAIATDGSTGLEGAARVWLLALVKFQELQVESMEVARAVQKALIRLPRTAIFAPIKISVATAEG